MLPPEGGPLQIGVLATSQETWPEVARSGRKPASQNRGGTPTGERIPKGCAAVPAARQVGASVCRRSASLFLSLFCPVRSQKRHRLTSVIAGHSRLKNGVTSFAYDPAIHAEAKRDQSFRSHLASRESPWTTGIGDRRDAVLLTAMPGGDERSRRRPTLCARASCDAGHSVIWRHHIDTAAVRSFCRGP
jgi:hypothetical protein